MQIKRESLLNCFMVLLPGLAKKEIVEQTTSFIFHKQRIFTYNDQVVISYPLPGLDFEGAVPAEKLYAFLSRLKKEFVKLSVIENTLQIKAGKSKAGFPFVISISPSILLAIKKINTTDKKWKCIDKPEEFINALTTCAISASQNMNASQLTGVFCTPNNLQACDNFRLMDYRLSTSLPLIQTILIPAGSIQGFKSYNPNQIATDNKGWLHFKNKKGVVYSIRLLAEANKFPILSLKKILSEPTQAKAKLPTKLLGVLQRALLFGEDASVVFCENTMQIESKGESGWYRESIPIAVKGKICKFNLSIKALLEAPKDVNMVEFTSSSIRFNGKRFTYCCAIQAIKQEKK